MKINFYVPKQRYVTGLPLLFHIHVTTQSLKLFALRSHQKEQPFIYSMIHPIVFTVQPLFEILGISSFIRHDHRPQKFSS